MSSTTVKGPSFLAFLVDDVARTSAFLTDVMALVPASKSPPGAVLFETKPIPFAIRNPTGAEVAGEAKGVKVWFACEGDVDAYRDEAARRGADATEVRDSPFGRMFSVDVPGGFSMTIHRV